MTGFPWQEILAVLGVLIPVIAFVWEFAIVGRKRLGYRIQMDTTPSGLNTEHARAWQRLERRSGERLKHPSFVLIRIENIGSAPINTGDYARPDTDNLGLSVRFPGRTVAGVLVTELSDDNLESFFHKDKWPDASDEEEEDGHKVGIVKLPKVKLNPDDHYKVLVVLERAGKQEGTLPEPEVVGTITKAGDGRISKTRGQTGTPRWVVALICFLLMVGLTEPFIFGQTMGTGAPLECARGTLKVTGSTAFKPVVEQAAKSYEDYCSGADIDTSGMRGSVDGLQRLEGEADPKLRANTVVFSDGSTAAGSPALVPRPKAFMLFSIIANPGTEVHNLTQDELRRVLRGEVRNWAELGGKNIPVVVVDRESESGTRMTLEERFFGSSPQPGENSTDCEQVRGDATGQVLRCRRTSTPAMLETVANTPGAIGYSESFAANSNPGVIKVRIDGQAADFDAAEAGAYPYWQTEYAYTYGEPEPESLPAKFLRFLTYQEGVDILRHSGHRPCAELRDAVSCEPSGLQ